MFDYLTRLEWKRQRRAARSRALLDLLIALAFFAVAALLGATVIAAAFGLGGLGLLIAVAIERSTAKGYTQLLEKP